MSAFLRRLSAAKDSKDSTSDSEEILKDTFTRRRSSTSDPAARVLGARDWKLGSTPPENSQYRASPSDVSARIFGARDWRRTSNAGEDTRRASVIEDWIGSSDSQPAAANVRRPSVPYGPRHFVQAARDRENSV